MTKNGSKELTLFTTSKPFRGHVGVIQRNAIGSWCRLESRPQVVLFGEEQGTAEAAKAFGVRHVAQVARNDHGTPLVSAMFEQAEALTGSPVMCYVNSDIVLMSDFSAAVRQLQSRDRYLMVGRRWDLDLRESLEFERSDWEERLRRRMERDAALHGVTGIDYFVFPKGLWGPLPPFAIGRGVWDNWLVYRARAIRAAVIDGTRMVTAVHQSHDYTHHSEGETGVWEGAEAKRNRELAGGARRAFTLADATHVLTPSGIRPALSMSHLKRRLVTAPIFFPRLEPIVNPVISVGRLVRRTLARTHP